VKTVLDVNRHLTEARERILEEARRKAKMIVEEAEREAELIVKKAEEEWKKRAMEEENRILEEARREAALKISEARRLSRLRISQEMASIIDELFKQAENGLNHLDLLEVEKSLENLLTDSLKYVDKPRKVYVSEKDVETMRRILSRLGLGHVEVAPAEIRGGLILESESGILVDNSYESRLKLARRALTPLIRKKLWG
jgi:V/A-type H+-transporting ATPase subunit E